jgi:hypothetical protein
VRAALGQAAQGGTAAQAESHHGEQLAAEARAVVIAGGDLVEQLAGERPARLL